MKNKPLFELMPELLLFFTFFLSCQNISSNGQITNNNLNDSQTMNTDNFKSTPEQIEKGLFPESNSHPYFYTRLGGEWVKLNDNWSIRLTEIFSDSRCPSGGGACEVSGFAKVKIQLMQPNVDYYKAYFETLIVPGLNRYPMPDGSLKPTLLEPIIIDRKDAITNKQIGLKITLADLHPYPFMKFVSDVKKIKYTGLIHIEELK
ncbi:MAG: hypothetical protein Q7W13_02670 [Bacteroidia bacterium]|nr:hypothetical protein [Bacteroidia bacterium]